jgi:hypothetical protein
MARGISGKLNEMAKVVSENRVAIRPDLSDVERSDLRSRVEQITVNLRAELDRLYPNVEKYYPAQRNKWTVFRVFRNVQRKRYERDRTRVNAFLKEHILPLKTALGMPHQHSIADIARKATRDRSTINDLKNITTKRSRGIG